MGLRVLAIALLAASLARAGEEFNSKVAAIDEFPREVRRGEKLTLKGTVKGAYRTPELILIAPNGKTYLNRDNVIGPYDFTFEVRFDEGVGPYRIEIMVRKENSYESAAQFTVWHGTPRGEREEMLPPPTGAPTPREHHPRLIEKHFRTRLNEFRNRLSLPPVEWNEAVASRAREHADRMAEAQRRVHGFGALGGPLEHLEREGARAGDHAGPSDPWPNLTSVRPFEKPAPRTRGPRVWNHVVTFVLAAESQEAMFETFFVREAAFRLCAADPNCVEVAVGAARTPPPPPRAAPKGTKTTARVVADPLVYYCVCFVQVNDRTILRAQEKAHEDLLREAGAGEPDLLRRVGVWGRGGKAVRLLTERLGAERDATGAAAFDGLLLLAEGAAREAAGARLREAEAMSGRGGYREAALHVQRLLDVTYDTTLCRDAQRLLDAADRAILDEARATRNLPEAERAAALRDLLDRSLGLPASEQVRRMLP